MNIKKLLQTIITQEASDLFLRTNSVPRMRHLGVVREIEGEPKVSEEEMRNIAEHFLGHEDRRRRYKENFDVDFAYYEPDVGRFRINVFTQRGTPAIVARHISSSVKDFKTLNLPDELLQTFCDEPNGLFLLCGPAGSGKTTTIASMIDYINSHQQKHIVTLEDPVEFIFQDKKSIINQRELEADVKSYPAALKHVTQQSPDIIYIGNIRDEETMQAAITATELGTFVLTTFHTINAVQTIIRTVNFFPPYLHDEVRMRLSILLKGVISLRLIPRIDQPGRIPAFETMVVTPTIARLIREGKINEIQNFIDEGELFGMQSFKRSLVNLVQSGTISVDDARRMADSKDDFELELKGVKRYLK